MAGNALIEPEPVDVEKADGLFEKLTKWFKTEFSVPALDGNTNNPKPIKEDTMEEQLIREIVKEEITKAFATLRKSKEDAPEVDAPEEPEPPEPEETPEETEETVTKREFQALKEKFETLEKSIARSAQRDFNADDDNDGVSFL